MGDAECVPEDNVSILNACVAMLFDPFRQTSGRFARCLRNVASRWMDLIVFVYIAHQHLSTVFLNPGSYIW